MKRRASRGGWAALTCVLLAGCAGTATSVRVVPPRPGPAAVTLCAKLAHELPSVLAGHARRNVRPSSPLVAAWANPPITLRCGVRRPAMAPTAELTVVNNVAWFPQPPGAASPSTFTAVGRRAYVEINVPGRYSPAAPVLVPISNAIGAAIPATGATP